MPSATPGIGVQNTRPTRAQRREEAAKVRGDDDEASSAAAPVAAEEPLLAADQPPASHQPPAQSGTPTSPGLAKLSAKKAPTKVPLNTYVLATTEKRLDWFRRAHDYSVTDVVDVALQELFDRNGVPPIGPGGELLTSRRE